MSALKAKVDALHSLFFFQILYQKTCHGSKIHRKLQYSMLIHDFSSKTNELKTHAHLKALFCCFPVLLIRISILCFFAIFRRKKIIGLFTLMNHRGTAVVAQMHLDEEHCVWMSKRRELFGVVKFQDGFCTPHSHTSFGCQRLFSSGVPTNEM